MQRIKRLKPFLYISSAGFATASTLYICYRPRNLPGTDQPASRAIRRDADGRLIIPEFPRIKTREEQILDLKKVQFRDLFAKDTERHDFKQDPSKRRSVGPTCDEPPTKGDAGDDSIYDLVVIGGGATGVGIALDAVTRGLKTALIERDDFACGTSSKSTKLVHGGVRYLEKAVWELDYNQFKLVREALRERKLFLHTAPHLSTWLPIMIPIQKWWQAPYFWAGTKFYDFLAGSEGIESSYFLTQSRALDAFPMLSRSGLWGALVYYDGVHNDSRMNVSLAMTAALYGATVVNHLEVTSLEKNNDGRLCGVRVRDTLPLRNGEQSNDFSLQARGIINATGPFTDAIRKLDDSTVQEIVAPSSGAHVILPGYFSPSKMGLIDPSTSDGRVIFFLPWQGNTIAGTTDAPCDITANPIAKEEEIQWILSEIRRYLTPDITIRREDVLATWSGIRPLVKDPRASNTESLVRNHLITTSDSGLITCAGGKWTTYRQMAEETIDQAIVEFGLTPRARDDIPAIAGIDAIPTSDQKAQRSGETEEESTTDSLSSLDGTCQTHAIRLIGAHGFSKNLFINLIQRFGIETAVAKHLCESYGDRAWTVASMCSPTHDRFPAHGHKLSALYPFVDGEVRFAVHHEYAQTAVDVLARRTRLAFLNAQAALEALPKIIELMSEELGWTAAREEHEWQDAVEFLSSMGLPATHQVTTRKTTRDGNAGQINYLRSGQNPILHKESASNK